MATSSRVFVRGLPPNMTQDDFVTHFSKVASPTDAKLIANRRIGYLGYRTPEAAETAIKYFNRSFIRTAKISAELARPIEGRRTDAKDHSRAASSLGETYSSKHAAHAGPASATNGHRSTAPFSAKRKFEAHLTDQTNGTPRFSKDSDTVVGVEHSDANADSSSPKRQRMEDTAEHRGERDHDIEVDKRESGTKLLGLTAEGSVEYEPPGELPSTSDTDWMRSRTSRLLDLIDADELVATGDHEEPGTGVARDSGPNEAKERNEASAQAKEEKEDDPPEAVASASQYSETRRLFVRNLPFTVSVESLRELFSKADKAEDVHIPTDSQGNGKGYAYVSFESVGAAESALQALDGRSFEGRLLHVMKASVRREKSIDMDAIAHLPLKKQKHIKRKLEASSATFRWNTLYLNPDAVLTSVADRLGVSKSEILDPTSSDAAVKQAHAETNLIQETKAYFAGRGVDLDSFKGQKHSDTVILVKNFPFGTSAEELLRLFEAYGPVRTILMPPSGVIAMVEMELPGASRAAFKALAYRRFKDTVLFLEKAPQGILDGHNDRKSSSDSDETRLKPREEVSENATTSGLTSTLFVKNLNFSTTTDRMVDFFKPLKGLLSARVKTYSNSKKPGEILSTGFGFAEFATKAEAEAALAAVNGHSLDGHNLVIRSSHKALDAAEERKREDEAKQAAYRRTKVIIKNLPFEATKKDLRALFSPYGKLRSVRVPKKFDRSTRGFGFADFISAKEAESAMNVLQGTHLLGRRLNLEFAAEDLVDPEEEIERMQQKVDKQTQSLSLQKMASGQRKKFAVDQQEEIDKF